MVESSATSHNTAITSSSPNPSADLSMARLESQVSNNTHSRFVVFVNSRSYFAKTRVLQITDSQIIVLDSKSNAIRFKHSFEDILGLTKSLRIGSKNFITHFNNQADEEWHSDQREEIILDLEDKFQFNQKKQVPIYGISTISLADYLSSEKDIARRISRMPGQEFLMSGDEQVRPSQIDLKNSQDDNGDLVEDDWVIVNDPHVATDLNRYNTKEKIARESAYMASGKSACILVGRQSDMSDPVSLTDFVIKKVIDKGSFGKVFLVKNSKTEKVYAMKRLNKDIVLQKNQVENIKVEKEILFQSEHPFVNSMDYVFQNELRIYFFLKYVPGGNIYDNLYKMHRFNEETVKFISAQIVLALGYLHSNGIVHRDLKPENVLMDEEGYICLADFGLAKFLKEKTDQTYSFCGTAEYLAPEILDMKGHGFSVDWWTLGILMYEMATGRPPFMNKSHHRLGILIRTGKIIFPDPVRHGIEMSSKLQDIITRLLDRDPEQRIGAGLDDAQEIINHPFFADVDWENLQAKKLVAPYKPEIKPTPELMLDLDNQTEIQSTIFGQDNSEKMPESQIQFIRDNQEKFKNF